jgi:hypothetical protein
VNENARFLLNPLGGLMSVRLVRDEERDDERDEEWNGEFGLDRSRLS